MRLSIASYLLLIITACFLIQFELVRIEEGITDSAAEAEKKALADQLNKLIAEMDETTAKITAKQEEIAVKEDELIQAQIDENNQYESMKKRIKYMYENGNTQFIIEEHR